MWRRINRLAWPARAPREKPRSAANVLRIRRKARKIRMKMKAAARAVKQEVKSAGSAEQNEDEEDPEGKPSKEEQYKQAVQAEVDKLRVEDRKAVPKLKQGQLFSRDEPIA